MDHSQTTPSTSRHHSVRNLGVLLTPISRQHLQHPVSGGRPFAIFATVAQLTADSATKLSVGLQSEVQPPATAAAAVAHIPELLPPCGHGRGRCTNHGCEGVA